MHKSSAASVGGGKGRVAAESSKKPDVAIAPAITDQMSSNAVRRVVMGDFHDAQRPKVSRPQNAGRLDCTVRPIGQKGAPSLEDVRGP